MLVVLCCFAWGLLFGFVCLISCLLGLFVMCFVALRLICFGLLLLWLNLLFDCWCFGVCGFACSCVLLVFVCFCLLLVSILISLTFCRGCVLLIACFCLFVVCLCLGC